MPTRRPRPGPARDETPFLDVVRKAMGRPARGVPSPPQAQSGAEAQVTSQAGARPQPVPTSANTRTAASTGLRLLPLALGLGIAAITVLVIVAGSSDRVATAQGTFPVTPDDYVAALPPSTERNGGGLVVELPAGGNALVAVNGDANVTSIDVAFVGSAAQLYLLLEPLNPVLSTMSSEASDAVIRLIADYELVGQERLVTPWFTLVRPAGQSGGSLWPLTISPSLISA